jgi:hypothetical protein
MRRSGEALWLKVVDRDHAQTLGLRAWGRDRLRPCVDPTRRGLRSTCPKAGVKTSNLPGGGARANGAGTVQVADSLEELSGEAGVDAPQTATDIAHPGDAEQVRRERDR